MNRNDFPLLKKYIYLDNSGSSLKPLPVINFMDDYYKNYVVNPHSKDSSLGIKVNKIISESRKVVAKFVNAGKDEIIFNDGTTSGLNTVASILSTVLKKDDEIIITEQEHASNIIPWIELKKKIGIKLIFAEIDLKKRLTIKEILNLVTKKTKVISVASMTNVKGSSIDLSNLRKNVGKNIYLVCDGAQAVAHSTVDFKNWDLDFLAFSATKIYGPFGLGVLVLKRKHLKSFLPWKYGGGSYISLTHDDWIPLDDHRSFEAGSSNPPAIGALAEAIKYTSAIGHQKILDHEKSLVIYAHKKLKSIKDIEIYTDPKYDVNFVFNIKNYISNDIVTFLGIHGIIARGGRHCAPLLFKSAVSAARLSFGLYNNKEDIDKVFDILTSTGDYLEGII